MQQPRALRQRLARIYRRSLKTGTQCQLPRQTWSLFSICLYLCLRCGVSVCCRFSANKDSKSKDIKPGRPQNLKSHVHTALSVDRAVVDSSQASCGESCVSLRSTRNISCVALRRGSVMYGDQRARADASVARARARYKMQAC